MLIGVFIWFFGLLSAVPSWVWVVSFVLCCIASVVGLFAIAKSMLD